MNDPAHPRRRIRSLSEARESVAAWQGSDRQSCRLAKVGPWACLAHVIAALRTGGADPATLTPAALANRFPRPR